MGTWVMNEACTLFLLFWTSAFLVLICGNETTTCNEELFIDPTSDEECNITSPGFPDDPYASGTSYTWCVSAPANTTVVLICDVLDIPKGNDDNCETNALVVSSNEYDSRSYCGKTPFRATSSSSDMKIYLHSSMKSRGGKFLCQVKTEEAEPYTLRAVVYENCDCGYSSRLRIVGGEETGINEFPFMAGLVDARRGAIILCGASIISPRFVLTADHCLESLVIDQTAVVVGEHNISTGSETSATRLIKAKRFIPYPYYDPDTRQYDIALIELVSPVTYSTRVGPVCLPFMSKEWNLTGEYVTVLGWGTTEFGGPRSQVLMKVDLDIIDIQYCTDTYGDDVQPYTQLCTYRENKDACQYDSGGPLVWFNSYVNRYEIVGLVDYGRGCANGVPSVNTKVAPFLQWILDNTPSETYCYKS